MMETLKFINTLLKAAGVVSAAKSKRDSRKLTTDIP